VKESTSLVVKLPVPSSEPVKPKDGIERGTSRRAGWEYVFREVLGDDQMPWMF
jgi:hypothetical protein